MRIRLVFMSGHQADLDSLCPKTTPAMLAGMLRNKGIPADYMDFGILDSFARNVNENTDIENRPGWFRFWDRNAGGFSWGHAVAHDNPQIAAFGEKLLTAAPSLIAWYVETRDGYRMSKAVSGHLRRYAPQIHQTMIGPYIARFGASAMSDLPAMDTGVTEDMFTALAALCESANAPESWGRIPGLIFRNRTGIVCSPKNIHPKRDALSETLGALPKLESARCRTGTVSNTGTAPHEQFALYPIAFVNDYSAGCGFRPGALRPLQKSAISVFEEMRILNDCYGAGAFHIEAPHVGSPTFERFADTLLAHNFMAIYSLGGLTEPFSDGLADRLFASGCRAVGFHAPSGSQRLLEDFYGCDISISAIRATLRRCRAAGLFTVVHLQYPCPKDDYHTRAETELFLEACRPCGVSIAMPELTPDSLWFMRASDYGFIVDHRVFQQWISCAAGDSNGLPYRMYGWKNGRAGQARHSLEAAAEKLGCVTGITERHGLLARIARSVMDESAFLEQLKHALDENDVAGLGQLMACVNGTLHTLRTAAAPAGKIAEAL